MVGHLITIEQVRTFIIDDTYRFYTHAVIEAKKDGVEPEDIVYVLLNGKIIEQYPERNRLLVYGTMLNNVPLHVVCNYSDPELLYVVTVYIPSSIEWIRNFQKRRLKKQ
jgi:hypothetical protein